MKLPKGPQLKKGSSLKPPAFLADFYYDLRDRRLLPVIVLILVAIVATPILLGQGSEPELPPAASGAIEALEESSVGGASLTVVESKPGLRDYRKRLRNRTPLDPFRSLGKPSLAGAKLGGGKGGGGKSSDTSFSSTSKTVKETTTKTKNSETTTKTETTTSEDGHGNSGGLGKGKGGGSGDKNGSGALPTYTIDVQISSSDASGSAGEPKQRIDIKPLTPLPGKKKPVVTYLGPATGSGRALFSVSKDVTAIFGEAKCVSGAQICEVLELEPDFPVTFVYAADQKRYRIKLLAIERAGS